MEVRQRVADTVRAGETESSKRDERVGQAIPASPLVEKGLRVRRSASSCSCMHCIPLFCHYTLLVSYKMRVVLSPLVEKRT